MLWLLACAGPGHDSVPIPQTTCERLEAPVGTEDVSVAPIDGLDSTWSEEYDNGYTSFELIYRSGSGIGPVYIHEKIGRAHV